MKKEQQEKFISDLHSGCRFSNFHWPWTDGELAFFLYATLTFSSAYISASAEGLARLNSTHSDASQDLVRILQSLELVSEKADIAKLSCETKLEELRSAQMEEERLQILRWLSPTNASAHLNAALKLWQEHTGLWFLKSEVFSDWIKHPTLIWLNGIGKVSLRLVITASTNKA